MGLPEHRNHVGAQVAEEELGRGRAAAQDREHQVRYLVQIYLDLDTLSTLPRYLAGQYREALERYNSGLSFAPQDSTSKASPAPPLRHCTISAAFIFFEKYVSVILSGGRLRTPAS